MLGVRCTYDAACAERLRTHVADALSAADGVDVPTIAAAAFAVSADAVAADPRRVAPAADVVAARGALLATIPGWTAAVRGRLDR